MKVKILLEGFLCSTTQCDSKAFQVQNYLCFSFYDLSGINLAFKMHPRCVITLLQVYHDKNGKHDIDPALFWVAQYIYLSVSFYACLFLLNKIIKNLQCDHT